MPDCRLCCQPMVRSQRTDTERLYGWLPLRPYRCLQCWNREWRSPVGLISRLTGRHSWFAFLKWSTLRGTCTLAFRKADVTPVIPASAGETQSVQDWGARTA